MTEKDILHALGCCRAGDCVNCPFNNEKVDCCRSKMLATAQQIISLQKERLEYGSNKIEELKKTNTLLQAGCRYTFTERDLINAVNKIVHYCLDNDEDEEGDQDVNIIRAMLDLGKLLPSGGSLIIHPNRNAPELKLGK